jgi:hypothetical protein
MKEITGYVYVIKGRHKGLYGRKIKSFGRFKFLIELFYPDPTIETIKEEMRLNKLKPIRYEDIEQPIRDVILIKDI